MVSWRELYIDHTTYVVSVRNCVPSIFWLSGLHNHCFCGSATLRTEAVIFKVSVSLLDI